MSEFLGIARSTSLLKDFLSLTKNLSDRMINQVDSKHMLLKKIKKSSNRHLQAFKKYHIMGSDILSKNCCNLNK